jgi:hypothetical protein
MSRTLRRRRAFLFRLMGVLLPTVAGAVFVTYYLAHRPLYLEEVVSAGLPATRHRFLYDELLGWKNIPRWRSTTFGQPLTINALGLRGREVLRRKPPGTRRLLILGDSFAWGYGVADEDVFAAVLERQFQAEGKPWEVLNAGVLGWGTDQQYLFLKRDGYEFGPDIVVVAFFLLNDPINNVTTGHVNWSKPVFLNSSLRDLMHVPCPKPGSGATPVWNRVDPLEMTLALLRAIAEDCRGHNCTLVVMKFGGYLDTGPTIPWLPENRPYAEIEAEFLQGLRSLAEEQEGLHVLDLDRAFAERGLTEQDVHSAQTSHWTPRGHAATATILREFLEQQRLVP